MNYTPPPGRPQSCPPMSFGVARPGTPSASPKYPQHSAKWYATRANPEFRKKFGRSVAKSYRAEEKGCRKLAATLNATETGGTWMTAKQYAEMHNVTSGALGSRARSKRWYIRPGAGGRLFIYLVPHEYAAPKPVVIPAALPAPPPVADVQHPIAIPRPGFWRRVALWFLP